MAEDQSADDHREGGGGTLDGLREADRHVVQGEESSQSAGPTGVGGTIGLSLKERLTSKRVAESEVMVPSGGTTERPIMEPQKSPDSGIIKHA